MDWRSRLATPAETAPPESLRAPLFRALVEQLDPERRLIVLDLGAAHTQTVALFGQFRCRLDIADLADDLHRLNNEPEPELLPETAEALLPRRHDEPVDLVLCWDLLNYLEKPALKALMARIAQRVRAGALVHSLIAYSEPKMPLHPGQFIPVDGLDLVNIAPDGELRDAPRYTPDDLKRCLSGFYIERAMLLSNGMQEFLFSV